MPRSKEFLALFNVRSSKGKILLKGSEKIVLRTLGQRGGRTAQQRARDIALRRIRQRLRRRSLDGLRVGLFVKKLK